MYPLSTAELSILDWIAEHLSCSWLDVLMPAVTALANGGMLWILLGMILLFFSRKDSSVGLQVLLALLIGLLICNLILKNAFDRIRPFDLNLAAELLISQPTGASFPSGHTSASFAAAMVLVFNRWKGRWPCLLVAALIGFSRLYLYVHYPTDILGGILTGTAAALLAGLAWNKFLCKTRLGLWMERRSARNAS